jgi:carboxylesterase
MGGALALLMSTRLDTKGVIAISTPYRLHDDWRLRYTDLISKVRPFMPKGNTAPDPGWFDKEAWKDHISYSHNPVRSIGELNKLLMAMHTALPQVRVPVLLIHSKDDAYILPENLERIYIELTNVKDKSKLYVTGSGHVVTRDAARGQVFEATANFIRRVESKPK